jgi:hypothetical protein
MSDSKDTVASAARILGVYFLAYSRCVALNNGPELEHLLLSQGISLPSAHVKSKDDASDVSDMDLGSPQPAQGTMNAEVPDQGKAKVKSKMKGPLRRVKHGYVSNFPEISSKAESYLIDLQAATHNGP